MPHDDINSTSAAQMFGQFFREKHRTVLSSRTAKRHHKVFKAAALVIAYACINQGHDIGKILVNAILLGQVLGNRYVLAGEIHKTRFAPWIGQAANIENKSAAI